MWYHIRMILMAKKSQHIVISNILSPFGTKEYENDLFRVYMKYLEQTTDVQAKRHLLEYLKTKNKNPSDYDSLPPKKYSPHGIYAKMHMDGIKLTLADQSNLDDFIEDLEKINKDRCLKKEQARKEKDRQEDNHLQSFLGDLNYFIDIQVDIMTTNKKPNSDVSNLLKLYNLSSISRQQTRVFLQKIISELKLVRTKKDEQLVEAYSFLSKKQILTYIAFLETISDRITTTQPISVRKKRTPKRKTPDLLVKKVQIQDMCDVSGVSSKPKVDIIGSTALYVYNTKTRFFVRYESDVGLSVKGSTLLNVTSSIKKKIRKPESVFNQINANNKKFMENFWNSIKTKESSANIRLGKTCVLVSIL